jgi:hypothetical protein
MSIEIGGSAARAPRKRPKILPWILNFTRVSSQAAMACGLANTHMDRCGSVLVEIKKMPE